MDSQAAIVASHLAVACGYSFFTVDSGKLPFVSLACGLHSMASQVAVIAHSVYKNESSADSYVCWSRFSDIVALPLIVGTAWGSEDQNIMYGHFVCSAIGLLLDENACSVLLAANAISLCIFSIYKKNYWGLGAGGAYLVLKSAEHGYVGDELSKEVPRCILLGLFGVCIYFFFDSS